MRSAYIVAPLALVLGLSACSRSGLHMPKESTAEPPECVVDADCAVAEDLCLIASCHAGVCAIVDTIRCDDGDACTDDSCDPKTGSCVNEPLTYDLDGDGHRAPLPGFRPGEPGSCGDDCDDTKASAYPGAVEVCDGVDNDCNGIVDDGMAYVPSSDLADAIRISGDELVPSGPGGMAFGHSDYLAAYTGRVAGKDGLYVQPISPEGQPRAALKVNGFPADASGGPVVFTGDRFGMAWQDRRNGDYEIYFNTLSEDGKKLGPDIAMSNELGFSLRPDLIFTGREFVVVWQDERFAGSGASRFRIWGQRLDLEGNLLGANEVMSLMDAENESPKIAAGRRGLGLVFAYEDEGRRGIGFQAHEFDLSPITNAPVDLVPAGKNGVYPTIVWNEASESFLVAYYDPDTNPRAIYATTIDELGHVLVPSKPVTESPRHSRYPALLPLGNRTLLVFSDNKDQNQGYELYGKMLDESLSPISPELRLTHSPGDSVFPEASFGPNGDVGVLFRDDREGQQRVYFSRLVCTAGNQP